MNLTTPVKNSYTFHPKINKENIIFNIKKLLIVFFFCSYCSETYNMEAHCYILEKNEKVFFTYLWHLVM